MESSGDESRGQAEVGAEIGLPGGHLTTVGLVIKTGEMKQPVEEQDTEFDVEGVLMLGGLPGGSREGDGEVAGMPVAGGKAGDGIGRKAEDVSGFVFAAKGAVKAPEFGVGGKEDGDGAREADGGAGAVEKAREGGFGGPGC